jgi:putative DNA primase/helicase
MTIIEQMMALGVNFAPVYDGTVHQISDPKGWYVGHEQLVQGEKVRTLILGLWKSDERYTFKEGLDKLKGKQLSEFTTLSRLQQEVAEEYKKNINEKTREKAQEIMGSGVWSTYQTEYMKRKKFDALAGYRFQLDSECQETMLIPMRTLDGQLWSVQRIFMSGDKEFLEGGRVQGTCFTFGDLSKTDRCFLVEGVATGASVFVATGVPTVCAFNASNLVTLAREIKAMYPLIHLTVAGDDDHENTVNIGREKAIMAAKKNRARFVLPHFQNPKGSTDFNDLHCTEGLATVREQLKHDHKVQDYILPLGYQSAHYYYTSSSNPQILAISEHSETDLYQLMPRDYWIEVYGAKFTKEGEVSLRVNDIKSDLMDKCRLKGFFKAERIRGLGVWQDNGQTVVHLGNRLFYERAEHSLMSLGEKNLYEFSEVQPPIARAAQLQDLAAVHGVLDNLVFTNPRHKFYLGGWLVGAYICGSLSWRPHLNITGEAGSGKSTVLDQFIMPILSGYKNFQMRGATTEAGLRQSVKSHAAPVIFDEFEGENRRSQFRLESVIELFRQASSEQGGGIVKGSASGEAQEYQARFMGIVSGIHPQITAGADRARFTQVELRKVVENADKQWDSMQSALQGVNSELARGLFSRAVSMLPIIKQNIAKVQSYLAKKQNQRFGQQYGTLLGCYWSLVSDDVISDSQVEEICIGVIEEEVEGGDKADTDHEECLQHLLLSNLRTSDSEGKNIEASVASLIELPPGLTWEKHPNKDVLATNGIFVTQAHGVRGFMIASKHPSLSKIFSSSKWGVNWNMAISRVKGTHKNHRVKYAGKQLIRGVFVAWEQDTPDKKAPF